MYKISDTSDFSNMNNTPGVTHLMQMAVTENIEKFAFFLDKNPDQINLADSMGKTALMYAAIHGCQDTYTYLLDSGADYSLSDNQRNTALFYAVLHGNQIMCRQIACRPVNLGHKNENGDTVLHLVCRQGFCELAKYLADKMDISDIMSLNKNSQAINQIWKKENRLGFDVFSETENPQSFFEYITPRVNAEFMKELAECDYLFH